MSNWIPVDKKLPDKETQGAAKYGVSVNAVGDGTYDRHTNQDVYECSFHFKDGKFYSYLIGGKDKRISAMMEVFPTHWQPKPCPPSEKEIKEVWDRWAKERNYVYNPKHDTYRPILVNKIFYNASKTDVFNPDNHPDPEGFHIRELRLGDTEKGLLETLDSLAPTSNMLNEDDKIDITYYLQFSESKTFVAVENDQIIGTATLLLDQKFSYGGKRAGHIENVAIHKDYQRKGIGTKLIKYLIKEAKKWECYKIILDCKDELVPYYKKFGFEMYQNCMRQLFTYSKD